MNNDWSIDETRKLFAQVYDNAQKGLGLGDAFTKVSAECGKSVNSVRNYYYAQLKFFTMLPDLEKSLGIKTIALRSEKFVLFSESEINELVESVLVDKAKGESIRSIIAKMANGDKKLALRYQNKYRSMVSTHPDKVKKIMSKLRADGVEYYDPYMNKVVGCADGEDNIVRLLEYMKDLDERQVVSVVKMLLNR